MKDYSHIDAFPVKKKSWLGRMYVAWVMLNLYPYRTVCILTAMFIAGIAEGLGLLTIMPLIEIISQKGAHDPDNKVVSGFADAFNALGLDMSLETILIAMVAFICLKALVTFIATIYVGKVTIDITTELRSTLITKILSACWSFFISQPIGKLVNAVSVEASGATNVYSNSIRMLSDLLKVLVLLYIAFNVSPAIVLVAVVVGICLFLFLDYFIIMSRKAGKLLVELTQSVTSIMTDALQGIKPLKTMNSERLLIPILHDEVHNLKKSMFKQLIAGTVIAATYEPVAVIVVAIGMYFAISHFSVPMSEILVLVVLFQRTIGGITQMQGSYQKVLSWEQYYWSVADFVNTASNAKEILKGSKTPDLVNEIKIRDLSFSYGSKKVLDKISLEIAAFSFAALVGESGSGKTTLIDLLCGLYQSDSGSITIDGVSLNDIDIKKWRGSIGYVPQELFLFHDSIMKNVSLGDPDVDRKAAEEALLSAGAGDFVAELPEGIDTIIGERGARLSGGQRQRIAIARALVRKPKLLILDEATTALDKKTENDILTTLHKLKDGLTIIAISHQSALLDLADRVYKLQDGKISQIK